MRFSILLFALVLAGCSGTGGSPIIIPAQGSTTTKQAQAKTAQPAYFNGEKYFMVSEADLNRFIAAYNKKVVAQKSPTVNAKVVNNEAVAEDGASMVNDFSLNNGSLVSIDDLVALPVAYVDPYATEEKKDDDWKMRDYILCVLIVTGLTLLACGWYKKRKKAKEGLTLT